MMRKQVLQHKREFLFILFSSVCSKFSKVPQVKNVGNHQILLWSEAQLAVYIVNLTIEGCSSNGLRGEKNSRAFFLANQLIWTQKR